MADFYIDSKCCCCKGRGLIPYRVQCEDTILKCPVCLSISHDNLTRRLTEGEADTARLRKLTKQAQEGKEWATGNIPDEAEIGKAWNRGYIVAMSDVIKFIEEQEAAND